MMHLCAFCIPLCIFMSLQDEHRPRHVVYYCPNLATCVYNVWRRLTSIQLHKPMFQKANQIPQICLLPSLAREKTAKITKTDPINKTSQ